ncbi:MAG TPA: IS66 family transposase [Propylenella sp.]|nr:IS66 family transposase [Propylenella sp.]
MPLRPEDLPREVDRLIALAVELSAENEQLRQLVKAANAQAYGPRSERASLILAEQTNLDLGDLAAAIPPPANDDAPAGQAPRPARRARRNVGALPAHLPRIERVIEPETTDCPCCAGALHRIGEDVSEALDVVPAIVRVIRTVRPKYACRRCQEGIVQAPARKRLIDGGMATTSLIAWVATAKFAWFQPLYRQMQMLAGQGVVLDRSTLAFWMERAAWWLEGLYALQLRAIHGFPRIFCDETRMPVLERGRRRTRTAQFWSHATDDRPWNGPAPPAVVYVFARGRGHHEIRQQLAGYRGVLQVDGYGAYKALEKARDAPGAIQLAFCLAHARRKFVEVHKKTGSPVSADVVTRIGQIYAIEARIRGRGADERRAVRQAESVAIMADLKALLDATLPQLSTKSALAKAIRYTLSHWQGLTRFLEDGRLEVDTNTVERSMRPISLGRKNSLFAGSEGGARTWAILASLLQTARLNGLDPYTWLNDVLERIVSGAVRNHELDQLLAWNWKAPANEERLAA